MAVAVRMFVVVSSHRCTHELLPRLVKWVRERRPHAVASRHLLVVQQAAVQCRPRCVVVKLLTDAHKFGLAISVSLLSSKRRCDQDHPRFLVMIAQIRQRRCAASASKVHSHDAASAMRQSALTDLRHKVGS